MRKGVNAWIYPQNFKITDILRLSKDIGYEGVELNIDEEMLKMGRNERRAILDEAKSLGLELPSLCTALFWRYNLASSDPNVRRRGVEIIRWGCEFASDIGAGVFLVVPAVATKEVSYQDMWRLSKESILEAAQSAEDCGVIIGVENVWNRFLYSPLEFRRFIEEINHPNVKVYFDVGNAAFLGFPEQWIKHLGDLIACVHIKDFHLSAMQFRPIFEGNIQWQSVIEALRKIGYNGFLIVEMNPYPGHPLKAAVDSKSALDIMLNML
ncbi:MAG: sugar phosphate isomerase/epimerase [Candidatus Bathyarchaeota archaeon]|nr:sugar phosphate isomerase/epimerase [Candidatus Bathyarchaeota archaeon]